MEPRHLTRTFVLSFIILLISFLVITPASAEYRITTDSIHQHIAVLAHDSLEGRQVGEVGEWKAAQYIINVFNAAGIQVVNIGIGMARAHTTEEYISLSDMVSAAEIVLACVATD